MSDLPGKEAFADVCALLQRGMQAKNYSDTHGEHARLGFHIVPDFREVQLARQLIVMAWGAIVAGTLVLCASIFACLYIGFSLKGFIVAVILLGCGFGLKFIAEREKRRDPA